MSKAKRRRRDKLSALAAFEKLNEGTLETSEGTSRTEALDQAHAPSQRHGTSETPVVLVVASASTRKRT